MAVIQIKKASDTTFDKELLKSYRRIREDYLWIFANEAILRTHYANEYIAVENKTVRFKDHTIEGLISKIESSHRRAEDFAIEYVGEHPVNFLF
jgi:ABC-type sugar transport system ATPase subunit